MQILEFTIIWRWDMPTFEKKVSGERKEEAVLICKWLEFPIQIFGCSASFQQNNYKRARWERRLWEKTIKIDMGEEW